MTLAFGIVRFKKDKIFVNVMLIKKKRGSLEKELTPVGHFLLIVAVIAAASFISDAATINLTVPSFAVTPVIGPTLSGVIKDNLNKPTIQTAPYKRPDNYTMMYCDFDSQSICTKKTGSIYPLKDVFNFAGGNNGLFGTAAVTIPDQGSVGMYPSEGFNYAKGTIEFWAKKPATVKQNVPNTFLSMEGKKSLSGNQYELIVGEGTTPETDSHIYFGDDTGLDLTNPAIIKTNVVRGVTVGDINGDKILDLLVSMNQDDSVNIFYGPIEPGQTYPKPTNANQIIPVLKPQGHALADLDKDGDLDVIVASYDPTTPPILGFENDGTGTFTPLNFNFGPLTVNAEAVNIMDYNKDGILDVLYASFGSLSSVILLGSIDANNKYTVGLSDPQKVIALDTYVLGIDSSDLNDDSYLDIIEARTLHNEVIIRYNDGTGSYPDDIAHKKVITTNKPFTVKARNDINNDGYLDLSVANWKDSVSSVYIGPDYSSRITFQVSSGVSSTIGDLNSDGINDIVFHSANTTSSPIFYLDVNGNVLYQENLVTQASNTNPGGVGEGAGMMASAKGTSTYGNILDDSNTFQVYYNPADNSIYFEIIDNKNKLHRVKAPFPNTAGFEHIQVEWNLQQGKLKLFITENQKNKISKSYNAGSPIEILGNAEKLSIGTGQENQEAADNWLLEELRISTIERTQPITSITN